MAHYQQASGNYTALAALTLSARQQVVSSVRHVAQILSTTVGVEHSFPNHWDQDSIIAACDLLDLVEDPTFETEVDGLNALSSRLGPEVFRNLFAPLREDVLEKEGEASIASALMDVSPGEGSMSRDAARSPPLKRMRSVPFPLPTPMEARTTSLDEASTSSIPSSLGTSCKRKGRS